jgi:hypothetical protein
MPQQELSVPEGWSLVAVKFHHDLVYWAMWGLHILSSFMPGVNPTPPAAEVSYTLCRKGDTALHTLRLPGDHAPDALAKALSLIARGPAR